MAQVQTSLKYTPFEGVNISHVKHPWQVVVFVHPYCDGTCAHCWSSELNLGGSAPVSWHLNYWSKVDPNKIEEIRLTGGEPLLNPRLGSIIAVIRQFLPTKPIMIFTSGRNLVSLEKGELGIRQTVDKMKQRGLVWPNLQIHLSADEYHIATLYNQQNKTNTDSERAKLDGHPLMRVLAENFVYATRRLNLVEPTFCGKLKIHAETGRLAHHRNEIFYWLNDSEWSNDVIATEGLVAAGRAKDKQGTYKIDDKGQLSLFLLPGAALFAKAPSSKANTYTQKNGLAPIFIDRSSTNANGVAIVGWWNIINRVFCGGTAAESLSLIGRGTS